MKPLVMMICFALAALFISCGETTAPDTEEKTYKPELPPGPDSGSSETKEKYFGMDYEGDTVIYEQDGKILTSGYVSGTFERIDRGDFLHIVLRDSNNYLHSFFMNTGDQRQMDKYFEGYQPARGHPVIVKWIRGPLQVSDGGAMETLYQAKEIIE